MDIIKILWEKIDRESEGTWRYEVFRDNIMEYIPKEEVAECKSVQETANRRYGKESITPINGNEYRAEELSKNKIVIPHGDKEEVAECKHRFINTNHLCTYCLEQVFTETKKIEKLNIKRTDDWYDEVEKKINEIINALNSLIK